MRITSKSGRFVALIPELGKAGYSVVATQLGVETFKSRWPCSQLPERPIRFDYASNGDLVGITGTGYDGPDMLALSQDAQAFAEQVLERRRRAAQRDAAWRREIENHG